MRRSGILIAVSNNKRKALKDAKIIINLDFNNKEINQYRINENAIIINCIQKKLDLHCFNGIIINDIEIMIEKKEQYELLYNEFLHKQIYRSFITDSVQKNRCTDAIKYQITNLIGINGKIDEKEIINLSKNIDKLENLH